MPYNFVTLEEGLRDLPTLREVLGPKWIKRESEKSAVDSDFLLTRLLTTQDLRNLVESLDQSLSTLSRVEGERDWHRRLRSNPEEFRATLAELAFAMLLLRGGIEFTHPDPPGVDFAIINGEAPPLNVEVIAPQKTMWADDLYGRLWYLGRLNDHSLRTEPHSEDFPIQDTKVDRKLMLQIVADSQEALRNATSCGQGVERHWPEIGLRIIWTPCADPRTSGKNHRIDHDVHPFKYVLTAARSKVDQMAKGHSHTLVLCWNMLPFPAFDQYVQSVQANVPYWGHFDWDEVPAQVHHLVLFQASYDQAKAPSAVTLMRPDAEQNLPEGFKALAKVIRDASDERRFQDQQATLAWLEPLLARQQREREKSAIA